MERPLLKIRVRYCGGCNPEIDRGSVVGRLQELLAAAGVQAVFCKDGEADWLLLVNGCSRACLEEECPGAVESPRCLSVEGCHLDRRPIAEEDLAQTLWERMQSRSG